MLKMIVSDESLKPEIGTEGSAGYDLKIANDVHIYVGKSILVGTGVKVEIPKGYVGLIVPRSSTGKKGLSLTNTVGVIDSDYQGEIKLNILNKGMETFLGYRGDRLFQLVIVPCLVEKIVYVKEFKLTTERAEGGFGSTGE
jgi:dUTP pyrophosphatase